MTVEWKPRGYPVRWALGVSVTIAVASLVSIWFGWATPRVRVEPVSWGPVSGEAGVVEMRLEVTNEAHTGVRLVEVGESLPGLDRVDGPAERPMGAGEKVRVTLRYKVTDCAAIPGDPPAIPVTVRTSIGLTRTVATVERLPDGDPWVAAVC